MPTKVQVVKRGKELRQHVPRVGRIEVSTARRRFTLQELLKEMKPSLQHKLEDDAPRGAEFI